MGFNAEYVKIGSVRIRLLFHLILSPKTPTELASLERKHLSNVSRTLGKLRAEGLVRARSTGSRETYYSVTREGYLVYLHTLGKMR